ncbi:hypothetical protein QNZ96_000824 [Vibrio parahaemolyticus]|nr:hypothetical protein [Vibrio parahaemolyticus]
MLFIYGALGIGGVETYFVRIAKQRHKKGLRTKLLLQYPEKSNPELLQQMKQYAEVYEYSDIFHFPSFAKYFKLTTPLKNDTLNDIFDGVDLLHVFQGEDALLAYRLCSKVNISVPISVGFYHYVHYLWGGRSIPYYEKVNRKFVLNYLPKPLLMLFSKDNISLYNSHTGDDFSQASTFSIGVIDKKNEVKFKEQTSQVVKVCAVGRLVDFKTYNIHLVREIKELVDSGHAVECHIYGSGPNKSKIKNEIIKNGLVRIMELKGSFDYSKFDSIVSEYDIFIGTGTAIVQASSLGVPSIAAIDNEPGPYTYGYFCNIADRQYGRKGLNIKKERIYDIVLDYIYLNDNERYSLQKSHVECIERYLIENSVLALDELKNVAMPRKSFPNFSLVTYELSRFIHKIQCKISKSKLLEKQRLPDEKFNDI